MPTMFDIRAYDPADADRVVELSLAAWTPVFDSFRRVFGESLYARIHPDWRADQSASVRGALEQHDTWVADSGDDLIGFVNVTFDEAARSGEIYMIAVDPVAQRRGVALALTEFALGEMRTRGITLAVVATGGDEGHAPARATYEKAGFIGCPQVWYAKQLV